MGVFSYVREETLGDHEDSVTTIEFSPDGRFMASGSEDGLLLIYSTIDWKPIRRFVDASPLTSLAWDLLSGRHLFCGFKSGDVHTIQFDPSKATSVTHYRWWGRLRGFSQIATDVWTDSTQGPIQFLTHHPNERELILGTGNDVLLLEYHALGGFKTASRRKRRLPSPLPFPNFQGELPEPIGRSAQFLPEKGVVVVSYLHHGVM